MCQNNITINKQALILTNVSTDVGKHARKLSFPLPGSKSGGIMEKYRLTFSMP